MSQKKTDSLLVKMLTENTGSHMLDSGSAYGRHWEENQEFGDKVEEWKQRPETRVDIDAKYKEVMITSDIFHFLRNHIERDDDCAKIEKKFYEFADKEENERESWNNLLAKFLGSDTGTNTYNFENTLGQVIQYYTFGEEKGVALKKGEVPDTEISDIYDVRYIFLQIHNGCDVRGGYTKPRVFKVIGMEYFLIHLTDIHASCECGMYHSDDRGYHWYKNDGGTVVFEDEENNGDWRFVETDNSGNDKVVCTNCESEVEFSCPMAF